MKNFRAATDWDNNKEEVNNTPTFGQNIFFFSNDYVFIIVTCAATLLSRRYPLKPLPMLPWRFDAGPADFPAFLCSRWNSMNTRYAGRLF